VKVNWFRDRIENIVYSPPDSDEPEPEPDVDFIRQRLKVIFTKHNKRKLKDIDTLLKEWQGKEQELLRNVEGKYAVDFTITSINSAKVTLDMMKGLLTKEKSDHAELRDEHDRLKKQLEFAENTIMKKSQFHRDRDLQVDHVEQKLTALEIYGKEREGIYIKKEKGYMKLMREHEDKIRGLEERVGETTRDKFSAVAAAQEARTKVVELEAKVVKLEAEVQSLTDMAFSSADHSEGTWQ